LVLGWENAAGGWLKAARRCVWKNDEVLSKRHTPEIWLEMVCCWTSVVVFRYDGSFLLSDTISSFLERRHVLLDATADAFGHTRRF